jgi:hypothetical protein
VSVHIEVNLDRVAEYCRKWKVTELALFGSVLREDFRPDSDVDVLVTFAQDAKWSLFDLVEMQDELGQLLGRDVDLVEREAIEKSENYIRRKHIFSNTEIIYVAR